MNDSYSATRVQVMRTKLIKQEDYERLLKMTEVEIISYLQSTEYRADIDALAFKDLDDLETIDRILARNTDRVMAKLRSLSSDEFAQALQLFLQENDRWNLKVIAESIAGNASPKDMLLKYQRKGTFDPMPLAAARSIEELSKLASRKVKELRKHPVTFPAFLDAITSIKHHLPMDAYLIDEQNITRLLLLKRDKVTSDQILRRMARGGTISLGTFKDAANAGSFADALKVLKGTRYSKVIDHAQDSMVRFEHELHQDVLRRLRHAAGRYPLSPLVIIRYLVEKDLEAANLRLLIKGKRLGLAEQFLREQLAT
jgi:V/A-type H+/Na+-transporting ATPase subunit C